MVGTIATANGRHESITLTNALRRIAADIGLKCVPRNVTTLDQYL